MIYDVSEHPLLSAKAAAFTEERLAEETALAAERLGISEKSFSGDDLSRINRYLVMQINYQILLDPEVFIKKAQASSQSKQSVVYRDGLSYILPAAMSGVTDVLGAGGWLDCTSVRRAVR